MTSDASDRRTIVIADDQLLLRAGFRKLLDGEDGLEVVGDAADGQQALQMVERLRPDVVLMDIRMPVLDGIEATRQISQRFPGTAVLVLTTYDLDEYVFAALDAGASGFLLKDCPPNELTSAIHVVARGDALIAPSITRRLIAEFAGRATRGTPRELPPISDREREVLVCVARGLSNSELAAELFIGEATVKSHVSSLLNKLACRDRVQLVVTAYEAGLVTPGSP
ncbi:MAG TPA: response regulator transcription factor [Nocardioides sp.]|jgi:DNA-binding NarL/FixJ family response regulator|uniref:response regulator transcription factor n=1 Tax=Nocardioides sp. TaxID=35761 RepID=UPI002E368453|nr:response regulator transcription factor [Nocardioides sp.]HEX3930029.1 response regulator transcription factor [Nocardioides sp.]